MWKKIPFVGYLCVLQGWYKQFYFKMFYFNSFMLCNFLFKFLKVTEFENWFHLFHKRFVFWLSFYISIFTMPIFHWHNIMYEVLYFGTLLRCYRSLNLETEQIFFINCTQILKVKLTFVLCINEHVRLSWLLQEGGVLLFFTLSLNCLNVKGY